MVCGCSQSLREPLQSEIVQSGVQITNLKNLLIPFDNILWAEASQDPAAVHLRYVDTAKHWAKVVSCHTIPRGTHENKVITSQPTVPPAALADEAMSTSSDTKSGHKETDQLDTQPPHETDSSTSSLMTKDNRATAEYLVQRAYKPSVKPRRSFLVLINPKSGSGRSLSIFHKQCEPVLQAAKCKYTVVKTAYPGHARDLGLNMSTRDRKRYDAVICCSGDGTPHEFLNGLFHNKQNPGFLCDLPICQVPCGSGNALAVSLNGSPDPVLASLVAVKGVRTRADLMRVRQGNSESVSFLSQCIGLIAEADLATEHLRWMGGLRFNFGVLQRIIYNKSYPAKLEVQYVHKDIDSVRSALAHKSSRREPAPAPQEWTALDLPHLTMFYTSKLPWVSAGAQMFPGACIADGCIDMILADSKQGFWNHLRALIGSTTGTHVDLPFIQYSKINAFRLTPQASSGYLAIDGESFPYQPISVDVLPSAITFLSSTASFVSTHIHK